MNSKLCFSVSAGAILLASLCAAPVRSGAGKSSQYVPPDVTTASDIQYPVDTLAVGAVSLLLSLDSNAQLQNIQVMRDFPGLTKPVQDAVQSWAFTPAMLNGNRVATEISVTAVFNIFNPGGGAASQSLILAPPTTLSPDASKFTPPQITTAAFADYPATSVSQGTVVLGVTIGKTGRAKQVRVLRGLPSLTQQAVSAVKTWGFTAATVQGQPVEAPVIIAFVFQRNMS